MNSNEIEEIKAIWKPPNSKEVSLNPTHLCNSKETFINVERSSVLMSMRH